MQRKSSSFTAVCLFVVLGLLAHAAWAQQDEDAFRLDPLIITATRSAERLSRTTRSVTVISGEDIAAQGTRTVADALRSVPGLDVTRTGSLGGTTSIYMRGAESDHTVVLIDGVKQNLTGGAIDMAHLSVDNIERIEVLRGSASTLYGSSAIGGVIHIFTKRGSGPLSVNLTGEVGSFGTNSQSAVVNIGSTRAGLAVSGSRTESDGHLPFNNQYDTGDVALRADLFPDKGTSVGLTLRYSYSEFHFPTDGSGNLCCRNQFNTTQETTMGLQGTRDLMPWLNSSLQLGFHEQKYRSYPEEPDGFLYITGEKHLAVDWQSAFDFELGELTLGVAHEDDEHTEDGFRRHNTAGYTQLHLKPLQSTMLVGGLRVEDHSQFGSELTYQVSAAYFFSDGTKLRSALGTGFREPSLLENFSHLGGNPNLRPEHSLTWELGIERRFLEDRLRLEGVFFANRFEDLIQYVFSPSPPNFFNVPEAEAHGVELSATLVLEPAWILGVTYTWIRSETTDDGGDAGPHFVKGEALLRRPEHKARLFGQYTRGRISGHADLFYVGSRVDIGEWPERADNPAHVRVNVALSYKLIEKERYTLEVFGRAENLFDEDYEEVYGFETPGIAAFGGIRVTL